MVSYRYYEGSVLEPPRLECFIGERSLDFNERADDPKGPDKQEWDRYVGTYQLRQWGKPTGTMTIHSVRPVR